MVVIGDLVNRLGEFLPRCLAEGLALEYGKMRRDFALRQTGNASPGRFVEAYVQALQHIEKGKHDRKPDIDRYLRQLESKGGTVPEGLRVCASRVLRSMYTLRSKRGIAHRNEIDPALYDLDYLVKAASWTLAELLRTCGGSDIDSVGHMIDRIRVPCDCLVEDLGDHRLVLESMSVRQEILVLLHSYYPEPVSRSALLVSLSRRNPASVRRRLGELWQERLVEGDSTSAFVLTDRGLRLAASIVRQSLEGSGTCVA